MKRFVDRKSELDELNEILAQHGAQFILVYGRRRVGKTTLLLHWAERTGVPFIYWVASRNTPAQVRLSYTRALWRWAYPDSTAAPHFNTWEDVFETTVRLVGDQKIILVWISIVDQ